ncbi:uncharacterized protein LOC108240317 isoform X2 [Kryptolebias marmoratus]|uniref:uncharacterized protein LOC108240317 isoform X2 n=1 Tax=Kryptolebias marmoratus TaxID=37003 RepID=UPI0007F8A3A8|nr:uncharacterized protein LOC108240317 isoform X2 [Kryptolebias marmoratus]
MALTMQASTDPQPESGSHTQESGVEHFSADLTHHTSDKYEEYLIKSDQPKEHSSVRLIPKEILTMTEPPLKTEKESDSVSPGPEPQKVISDEEEDLGSLDVLPKHTPSPSQQTAQEEEVVEPSPGTSAIIEEEENAREDSCLKMEDRGHPAGGEAGDVERGRNDDNRKKRRRTRKTATTCSLSSCLQFPANRKKLIGLIAVGLIVVIAGIVGTVVRYWPVGPQQQISGPENNGSTPYCRNCFTCMDRGKCLNMTAIYKNRNEDHPIYQKNETQTFPKCSEMKPPGPDNCSVCFDGDDIRICCAKNITAFTAEERGGSIIANISNQIQCTPGPARNGATSYGSLGCPASSVVFIIIMAGVLLINNVSMN